MQKEQNFNKSAVVTAERTHNSLKRDFKTKLRIQRTVEGIRDAPLVYFPIHVHHLLDRHKPTIRVRAARIQSLDREICAARHQPVEGFPSWDEINLPFEVLDGRSLLERGPEVRIQIGSSNGLLSVFGHLRRDQ